MPSDKSPQHGNHPVSKARVSPVRLPLIEFHILADMHLASWHRLTVRQRLGNTEDTMRRRPSRGGFGRALKNLQPPAKILRFLWVFFPRN
ncbi:hypothetical protein BaRGS_00010463 [Batillaria attramentaria]|uniref:Uncharacterized protein n=1 Tax=Batillaria attramentaria TaxID=370345 RepID=A0ABD0LFK7_9CAEN